MEADEQSVLPCDGSCRLEVAGDLGRVVGVAVVDADVADPALELHPPGAATEAREPDRELLEPETEPKSGRQRRQRVHDVVGARHLQRDRSRAAGRPGRPRTSRSRPRRRSRGPAGPVLAGPTRTTSTPCPAARSANRAAPGSSSSRPGSRRARSASRTRRTPRRTPRPCRSGRGGRCRRSSRPRRPACRSRIAPSLSSPSAMNRPPVAGRGVEPRRVQGRADRVRRVGAAREQRGRQHRRRRRLAVRARDDDGGPAEHAPTGLRPTAARAEAHARAARTTSGLSSLTAVETTTVSASSTCAATCPTQQSRPASRSPSSRTESFASLPVTVTPRPAMMPRQPGQRRAADADEVHAAELLARPDRRRERDSHGAPLGAALTGRDDEGGQPFVGVAPDEPRRRGRHLGQPGSGRRPAAGTCSRTQSGVNAASSTSTPPPASTTASAFSACSPLPIGSGTKTVGQPDGRRLGDRVGAGPPDHRVRGCVGRGPSGRRSRRRRTPRRARSIRRQARPHRWGP